jgi:putative ABC transport system substrate-binding protein
MGGPLGLARLTVLAVLALALLAAPLVAQGQSAVKVPRIGYLCAVECGGPRWEAFVDGLAALGYQDGRSIAIVYSSETTSLDRLREDAIDLVRLKVDLIFVAGDVEAARVARGATSSIPIVMAVSGDPIGVGLISSLARPGGNLTGITYVEDELVGKQIQLLKEVVPTLSRVGALVDLTDPTASQRVTRLDTAARSFGLRLNTEQTRAPTNFEEAFAGFNRAGIGGLVIVSSPNHFAQRSRLAFLATQRRLASIASFREFAEARGLLAYGPAVRDVYRRAASFVDRILKGARPTDLPVEQPTRFELVVNLLTAKDLGLTIPPVVLARADEVIQ